MEEKNRGRRGYLWLNFIVLLVLCGVMLAVIRYVDKNQLVSWQEPVEAAIRMIFIWGIGAGITAELTRKIPMKAGTKKKIWAAAALLGIVIGAAYMIPAVNGQTWWRADMTQTAIRFGILFVVVCVYEVILNIVAARLKKQ